MNTSEVKSSESVNLSTVKPSLVSVVLDPPVKHKRPQKGVGIQTEAPLPRFAEQSRQLKIIQSGWCCPQNPRKFTPGDDSDRVMIGQ